MAVYRTEHDVFGRYRETLVASVVSSARGLAVNFVGEMMSYLVLGCLRALVSLKAQLQQRPPCQRAYRLCVQATLTS